MDSFPLGDTEVTVTFTDDASNEAACTFTVTVSQPPSTGVTVSGCPADITQEVAAAGSTAVVTWTPPTAVDSNGTPVTNVSSTHNSGTAFSIGMTTVTTTFTDSNSNQGVCSFTVTIEDVLVKTYEFYLADNNMPATGGSLANPFLMESSSDLANIATLINNNASYILNGTPTLYAAASYRLVNSLDLDSTQEYTHTPIGSISKPFTGTFDGNEKTLTNLSYSNSDHPSLGLFSAIDGATISDLTLSNPSITNASVLNPVYTGALVGSSSGNSVISNVSVIGGTIQGSNNLGGLVGDQSGGTITASSSTAAVIGGTSTGGLVGKSSGTITASYAAGAVPAGVFLGGLVGIQSSATITASYWDTQTTSLSGSAGTGATGYTTTELQVLGGAGTIYSTWTSPPWVFMAGAYPTLSP